MPKQRKPYSADQSNGGVGVRGREVKADQKAKYRPAYNFLHAVPPTKTDSTQHSRSRRKMDETPFMENAALLKLRR
jgi:hypothetical protein